MKGKISATILLIGLVALIAAKTYTKVWWSPNSKEPRYAWIRLTLVRIEDKKVVADVYYFSYDDHWAATVTDCGFMSSDYQSFKTKEAAVRFIESKCK